MTIVSRGVLLFLLDEVGVGIEGSPPLLLLLLVHAGAVGAGSVVEHPAQVGVQGEVGRGGGGALGGVLGLRPAPHHHGAAGGSCRSVLQAAAAAAVVGQDPVRGSPPRVQGEGDEEGRGTAPRPIGAPSPSTTAGGSPQSAQVDQIGLVVHVDGLDEEAADLARPTPRGGGGCEQGRLVVLAEVGHVHGPPSTPPGRRVEGQVHGGGAPVPCGSGSAGGLLAGAEGHLDLDHGLLGVVHEVLDLARVDPNDAQEEVAGDSQGQRDGGVDDGVDRVGDVGGEDLGLGQLLVGEVGGEPVGWGEIWEFGLAEGGSGGRDDERGRQVAFLSVERLI